VGVHDERESRFVGRFNYNKNPILKKNVFGVFQRLIFRQQNQIFLCKQQAKNVAPAVSSTISLHI